MLTTNGVMRAIVGRGAIQKVARKAGILPPEPEEAKTETAAAPAAPVDAGITVGSAPTISTQLLAEARRAGLDLNTLAPDELDAFASGGVAGLTRYRAKLWDDEASKRPAQPNVMA